MGMFNGYTKPGKGVDKNEPEKTGIALFIKIIVHKFKKFISANFLYVVTSIIWIAFLFFFAAVIISNTGIAEKVAQTLSEIDVSISKEDALINMQIFLQFLIAAGMFILWGSGPSSAAYSYITRCFTRGEHVWVLSDGKDKFKENFKQGMIIIFIDALFLILGGNAALFYYSLYKSTHGFLWLLFIYGSAVIFAIYTMMHPYLYQIMITFDCSILNIYKNAFLFAIAKLPGNVLTTLISMTVILMLFNLFNPIFASIFLMFFGLCITRYVTEFYACRAIEHSVLKNMKTK